MDLILKSEWWEYLVILVFLGSPFCLGFLNAFENRSQETNSVSTLYSNAFNASTSEISNTDGSTQITLGGESSGGGTSGVVVVAFAAVLILGGLYLLTRKR
jgi:hypothetical protein